MSSKPIWLKYIGYKVVEVVADSKQLKAQFSPLRLAIKIKTEQVIDRTDGLTSTDLPMRINGHTIITDTNGSRRPDTTCPPPRASSPSPLPLTPTPPCPALI